MSTHPQNVHSLKSPLRQLKQAKLLQLLSSYVTIKDISKELNIKQNSVYKTLRRYIKKGLINPDRTLTLEGVDKVKRAHATFKTVTYKQDTVRAHNLVFTISIRHLKNWNKRREFLQLKDIKFRKVGYNWDGEQIIVDNIKAWLTPLSIVIYMPQYYAEEANTAFKQAIDDLFFNYIPRLERLLETSLKDVNGYKIRVSRQHYALVKNALATEYYKENKKLYVRDEKGLWLLIDNSLNLKELETVHSKTARDDNIVVQDFFNDLKQNPITPSEILGGFSQFKEVIQYDIQARKEEIYNKQLHQKVLEDMRDTLKKIQEGLDKT